MTSPFGSPPPPPNSPFGPPPPPGSTPVSGPPPPGSTPFGSAVPPRPPSATSPPPGYVAYDPSPKFHQQRAGFGARWLGWLLDGLLYGLLAMALTVPGIVLIVSSAESCSDADGRLVCRGDRPDDSMILLGVALLVVAVILVFVLYFRALGTKGQTWGRKIAGVKVVGEMTGEPIGVGAAIGRQLFAWLISGQFLYLGYLWMLWDANDQTWHDKVAGSIVVTA